MKLTTPKLLTTLLVFVILGISWAGQYASPELFSDHPFLQKIVAQLRDYQKTTAEDRVYLHLDNTFYEPGESIWFNAYVRDASTFKASGKSEIVYVEFLNAKGSVEQQLNLIAQNGTGSGTFALPSSIKGGIYTIKAYTQWQKNTGQVFTREITIQKPVLPNLNMRLNFNKKAYGEGEQVAATLDLNTLTNKALASHAFSYVISLDGQEVDRKTGTTNELGRATLRFQLPKKLATNDGLLNVLLEYKGQTESISRAVPIVLGNIDLAFYPEGGELIEGLACGVAFKALNEFGKPADVSGHILDQAGNVVTTFDSYHQGMGSCSFVPKKGEQYQAKITRPANIDQTYPLPAAKTKGHTLRINPSNQHINLDILASEENPVYLVAQTRNQVYYTKELAARKGLNNLTIPTDNFPIGISQITLFNHNKIAVAERLVFVNPDQQLNISVTTDKEKYLPREQVNLELKVTDDKGRPVSGDFSLAVVDDKLLNFADDKQGHLLAYMLLESDLQGEIVEPNFYFDKEDDPTRLHPDIDRQKALDHLLMTQGWRHFVWKEVLEGSYKKPTVAGEMADITGTVLDEAGKPAANVVVELQGEGARVQTNSQGQFNIDNHNLYKPVKIKAQSGKLTSDAFVVANYKNPIELRLWEQKTITGIVVDEFGEPIIGANIYAGNKRGTTTDLEGNFKLEVPGGTPSLQVSYVGYSTKTIPLDKGSEKLTITMEENVALENIVVTSERIRPVASARLGSAPGSRAEAERRQRRRNKGVPRRKREAQPDVMDVPAPAPPPAIVEEVAEEEEMVDLDVVDHLVEEEAMALVEKQVLEEKEAAAEGKVLAQGELKVAFDKKDRAVAVPPALNKAQYHRVRAFPVVQYQEEAVVTKRTDFRSTIYWNPRVQVKNGKANLSFYNNDAITQFRITVEGFGEAGQLGRLEQKYFTQLPVELLSKIPREVLTGDQIKLPLTLTNNTNRPLDAALVVTLPEHLKLLKEAPQRVQLAAGASKTIYLECEVLNVLGEGELVVALKADGLEDELVTTVQVNPRGFPVQGVYTGDQMRQEFSLTIQEALEGSLVAKLQAYPNTLDEVMKGMENMLRMPSGCFEQTSSSNYPNLLVLDYLRETNALNPDLEERVTGYLKTGYARLTGYESPSGGFDWWGRDPAHEALTAYGLMEFVDMQRVYKVDQKLIDRTAKWLLSRRDGKGGWKKNNHALHSWALAEVTDAYIVWAVTEAGYGDNIQKELEQSYQDAIKSEDPYRLALLANALFKAKDSRANGLVKEIAKLQQEDGSFKGLTSSVTNSTGQSLMVETTSLVVLAMLQSQGYNKAINSALKAIQKGKNSYGYGSTQGTVLALKAMLEHAKNSKKTEESGELMVFINNKQVATLAYEKDQKEIVLPDLAQYLKEGENKVEVQYAKTKTPLPWDMEISYTTRLPQNSPNCALALTTKLPQSKVKMGENIRLTTTLSNTSAEGQPMTMAMIGIPAGLSVQPWQLKKLQEENVFDYYELFEGYVVLHYEQLTPKEQKTIHLDLKADVPGSYEAPASSAFLYYTNEDRIWAAPERLVIQ